jgi:cell division septal protein FtsQ
MKKPQSRNQRISKPAHRKRQHLLEVSARREIARKQRNRAIFGTICKLVLLVGSVGGVLYGGHEVLRRFLWENPEFHLTDVRVTTDGALTREEILSAASIVEGRNIFTIDLAKAREALDALPQVERVELQRDLPNRITINISERRPIAWLAARADDDPSSSKHSLLIDARGVVIHSETILPEYLHLPVVSGVVMGNLKPGMRVRSYEMQAALDLIRLNADSARFQPRNLDISRGYCVVVTDQHRRKITFGLDHVDHQLERLMRFFNFLEPSGREIQTVNLLVERNTPVVFAKSPEELDAEADSAAAKNAKDAKPKSPTPSPAKSPAPAPAGKPSTPAPSRAPIDTVKKPFRLHG